MLESLFKMKVAMSDELKYLLQFCAQETAYGDKKYDHCSLKLMVQRHLEQNTKDSRSKARNRDEDRPAIGAPIEGEAKEKGQYTAKKNKEIASIGWDKLKLFDATVTPSIVWGSKNLDDYTGHFKRCSGLTERRMLRIILQTKRKPPSSSLLSLSLLSLTKMYLLLRTPRTSTTSADDQDSEPEGDKIESNTQDFQRARRKQPQCWQQPVLQHCATGRRNNSRRTGAMG